MTSPSTPNSNSETRGIHCRGCNQLLPLRMSGHDEIAALWECAACGVAFAGVLELNSIAARAQAVRLAQIHFEVENAEPLPADFSQLAKELTTTNPAKAPRLEQRRSPREVCHLDAIAVGLNANFALAGHAVRGSVVNLSAHGMLLATADALQSVNVAVQMFCGTEKMQLLGKVVWSKHLGRGCYGAGIEFAARLGKVSAVSNPSKK